MLSPLSSDLRGGAGPKFMKFWLENAFSAIWPRAILVDLGPPPLLSAIVSAAITKEIYLKYSQCYYVGSNHERNR